MKIQEIFQGTFNPLNAKLNPICHLLALLGAHHILHVSRIRVKLLSIVGQVLYLRRQTIEHPNPRIICSLLVC